MKTDRIGIFIKEFSHLSLGKPDGVFFEADLDLRLAIFALINFDLFVFSQACFSIL